MEIMHQKLTYLHGKVKSIPLPAMIDNVAQKPLKLLQQIRAIGYNPTMDDYEKRKLRIFNQLNFFQIVSGIIVPVAGLLPNEKLPISACIIACLPVLLSVVALLLNYYQNYQSALLCYFILYPFFTCIVFINGMNLGIGLSFIMYGVLAVFFLQDIGYMLFTIAMSMMSYFILCVVLKNFRYHLEVINKPLYFFNQALALAYIFYGLFLIKEENAGYQFSILKKNKVLRKKNHEIGLQQKEIAEKAALLNRQKDELTELNALKSKLFSVIAHDLKSPMYALRNLFKSVQQQDLPPEEIKAMVPDVMNDLNYTVGLMENLLEWAKYQMQSGTVKAESVDITALIDETLQLLRLQAAAKKLHITRETEGAVFLMADKDMVRVVLRNLLTNAIKFTPPEGHIAIGVNELTSFVEVYVQDNGTGISAAALDKIAGNNYYTTKGTAQESGTGLGLMLCKEFLNRNGGKMHIESQLGKGSTFSFTLPIDCKN